MGIFKITSLNKDMKGKPQRLRMEYVDTSKNILFKGMDSKSKVENAYEEYWNLDPLSKETIKVLRVDRTNVLSKGENWGIQVWKLQQVI
jgi:hypothetical protein